ncbi:neprilysin-1-like [Ornithodoros turicata]|uniref:neprilysin-1-like n=1 Tax=Ornithodoros turicata TaxID=34597 RepID=UPI003138FBD0
METAQSTEPLHVHFRSRLLSCKNVIIVLGVCFIVTSAIFGIGELIKERLRNNIRDKSLSANGNLSVPLAHVTKSSFVNGTNSSEKKSCDTEDCHYFRWLIDASIDDTKDPCQNFHAFVCTGIEKKYTEVFARTSGGIIDIATRNVTYKYLATTKVPLKNQAPFEKAAAVFQDCLKVSKDRDKNKEEIWSFLNLYGLSFSDEPSFDPLDIMIRFVATIDIPILFKVRPEGTGKHSRFLIRMSVAPEFTSENFKALRRILKGHYKNFVSRILSTALSVEDDAALASVIMEADLKVINATQIRSTGNETLITMSLSHFGILENNSVFGFRWIDILARHTNNHLPGSFLLSIRTSDMKLFHYLFDSDKGFSKNDLKVFMTWRTILYFLSISGLEMFSNQRCFDIVSSVFPRATASPILSQAVDESKVDAVKKITEIIITEIENFFTSSPWLDDESHKASLKTLSLMSTRIGYNVGLTTGMANISTNNIYPDFTGPYVADLVKIRKMMAERRWQVLHAGPVRSTDPIVTLFQEGNIVFDAAENVVSVLPGGMNSPLFTYGAPPEVNFATLGRHLAREIMRGFERLSNRTQLWTNNSNAAYEDRVTCFNETITTRGPRRMDTNELLLDILGQRSVLNAYEKASQSFPIQMGTVKPLTKDQLYYVSWCVLWCGQRVHGQPLQDRCNVPLMQSFHFSEVFRCSTGAPMNPQQKCLFW